MGIMRLLKKVYEAVNHIGNAQTILSMITGIPTVAAFVWAWLKHEPPFHIFIYTMLVLALASVVGIFVISWLESRKDRKAVDAVSSVYQEFLRYKEENKGDLVRSLSPERYALLEREIAGMEQLFYEVETNGGGYVPISFVVAHVAKRIKDTNETKCYPDTLTIIRQRASDGSLRMRGRKQLDTIDTQFSNIHTDIPKEYWNNSVIGPLATSLAFINDYHTNPETAYSWGKKGVKEPNRYAALQVEWSDVMKLWPEVES